MRVGPPHGVQSRTVTRGGDPMRLMTTKKLRTLRIAARHHHRINSRLAIVRSAEEYGFKGAARRFGLDRKTVRTWHRRWVTGGLAGLVPLIRACGAYVSPGRRCGSSSRRVARCTLVRCGPGSGSTGRITFASQPQPSAALAATSAIRLSGASARDALDSRGSSARTSGATVCRWMSKK